MSLSEVSILLVDDEEVIRKSFARELQLKNFPVTAVASGSEAINALEAREYDLVITDLMMPEVDGFKVLKSAKKLAPLTSVIILTGYGDTQSAIDALRLGADDFVRKPCEIEEIVFRIRSCLEKRNLLIEHKKAVEELQESKTFNLATLNALSAEIAVLDCNGLIIAVNDSWRNFALENGLEVDKLAPNIEVGANYLSVCKAVTGLESDDALKSYEGIQSVLDGRLSSFNLEYPCHSPDEERWFNMNVSPLILENQRYVVVAHTNITELKKTEEALRQSEQRRCLALESAQAGTWEWDLQTNTSIWSDQLWALHELEPRIHEISYEEWLTTIHPEDLLKTDQTIKKSFHGEEINVEWRVKLTNKKERWLMSRGQPLRDDQGRVVRYLGTLIDITERKRAEEQLKAALAEKEVMLREIHHRVKNNLQVISSLVSLQADNLTDKRTREEFNDMCDRIRSMALIHEKLYQTDNLAQLNFADYTTSLLQYLWSSHDVLAEQVRLNLVLSPVILSIETAVPCGLILNELASNALKHAFPNSNDGEVTVELEQDSITQAVCLRVRDNGVGLPSAMDWRQSKSLGLFLVQLLAEQLRGTVETGTCSGTEFRITFPSNKLKSQVKFPS